MTGYAWTPTVDYIESANVTRLGRTNGHATLSELRAHSVEDIGWYWDAVVRDLRLPFRTPYDAVVDLRSGIEHPEWFTNSTLNIVDACLGRWRPESPALVHEAEDGTVTRLTYGELRELVCRQPWPAMTRGVWKDDARYLEAYWTRYPGLRDHGDFALVEPSPRGDQWFILGRSDDVMNVAGKRLAPAEVESVLITHPAVVEAAAVGVPDSTKGETVWAFWVPREGAADVSAELRELVATQLGKPFAPSLVRMVQQLPKTRSQKILRRAVRAAALGLPQADLSGAENPTAVDVIRAAVGDTTPH